MIKTNWIKHFGMSLDGKQTKTTKLRFLAFMRFIKASYLNKQQENKMIKLLERVERFLASDTFGAIITALALIGIITHMIRFYNINSSF